MNRRAFLLATSAATSGALAGCTTRISGGRNQRAATTTEDESLSGTIRIAGSSTVYPLTVKVGEIFSQRHPGVTVSVSSTGTGGGFADFFCRGRTAINDASREIDATERDACTERGIEPVELRVAADALTVVVNNDADWVDCVTPDELAEIWREGGATTWRDVREAWPDEKIDRYGAAATSGTFDYFREAVIGDGSHREDYFGTEQDNTIIRRVADSEYAMGYFGFAYYLQNRDSVKALAIDDGDGCVEPSLETAKSGAYTPLSRPLFVYVAKSELRRPEVREFCRFYVDQSATTLPHDIGYVPLTEANATENRRRLERAIEAAEASS